MHMIPHILVFPLLGCCRKQVSPSHGLAFSVLWLCSWFPLSWLCLCWAVLMHRPLWCWSCLCRAVVVHRFPLVFVLPLLGCGCEWASPGLGLAFARLWLFTGFPRYWSCLCWAVVVNRFPPVMILPFLCCGCAHGPPCLGLAFAGLLLCTCFFGLGLAFVVLWL